MADPDAEREQHNAFLCHFRQWGVGYGLAAALAGYTTVGTSDRFTGSDAAAVQEQIRSQQNEIHMLEKRISALPPRELVERVVRMELLLDQIKRDLTEMRRGKGGG